MQIRGLYVRTVFLFYFNCTLHNVSRGKKNAGKLSIYMKVLMELYETRQLLQKVASLHKVTPLPKIFLNRKNSYMMETREQQKMLQTFISMVSFQCLFHTHKVDGNKSYICSSTDLPLQDLQEYLPAAIAILFYSVLSHSSYFKLLCTVVKYSALNNKTKMEKICNHTYTSLCCCCC